MHEKEKRKWLFKGIFQTLGAQNHFITTDLSIDQAKYRYSAFDEFALFFSANCTVDPDQTSTSIIFHDKNFHKFLQFAAELFVFQLQVFNLSDMFFVQLRLVVLKFMK